MLMSVCVCVCVCVLVMSLYYPANQINNSFHLKKQIKMNQSKTQPNPSLLKRSHTNPTHQVEYFPRQLGSFHMSVWERACRKHLEMRRPIQKYFKGDRTNLLTVRFKADQSDFFAIQCSQLLTETKKLNLFCSFCLSLRTHWLVPRCLDWLKTVWSF